jgi:hypothetical protein
MLDANEIVWTPELEPFDEEEPPIREIDHSGDDPGPETISTGEIRPLEAVDG